MRVGDYFGERLDSELSETRLQLGPDQYHKFDLVSSDGKILIECKSFTWTDGGNFPQAKVSTANETILFLSRVEADKKMLVMQDDLSPDGRSLVKTYAKRYGGLTDNIEVWQYIPRQESPDTVNEVLSAEEMVLDGTEFSPDTHQAEDNQHIKSKNYENIRDGVDGESRATELNFDEIDYKFDHLGTISFERNSDGVVEVKRPQSRYSNSKQRDLHPHGDGPFCQFEIDYELYEEIGGVFLIKVDDTVKYVGKSSNIGKYIYDISNVSPSACYEGGQQTVCRINTKIFHAAQEGRDVSVWVSESKSSERLKQELLERFTPTWNIL
jgi:hypothetical protein